MTKWVNVKVSANISTDFFIEVDDNATTKDIIEQAKHEIALPTKYPEVADNYLQKAMNIKINGMDKLFKEWEINSIDWDAGNNSEGE